MRSRVGKRAAILTLGVGILLTGGVVFSLYPALREQYLIWRLDSDDVSVQKNAAAQLGAMGSVRAIPRLLELLTEADAEKRTRRRKYPAGLPRGRDLETYRQLWSTLWAGHALLQIGKPAIPALTAATKSDYNLGFHAALTLAHLGPAGCNALCEALRSGNVNSQVSALHALRVMGPEAASSVPVLVELLDDPTWHVRYYAIVTLKSMGPLAHPAIPALEKLAASDAHPNVRQAAAEFNSKALEPR